MFEVIDLVSSYDAEIVGLGELLDRSNGSVKFDYFETRFNCSKGASHKIILNAFDLGDRQSSAGPGQ